ALWGVSTFVVMLVGLWLLVWKRAWWLVGLMLYFFPIWFMWGTRVKPRYMLPVTPVIVVCLWMGMAALLKWWFARGVHQGRGDGLTRLAGRVILAGGVLANVPTYGIEFSL